MVVVAVCWFLVRVAWRVIRLGVDAGCGKRPNAQHHRLVSDPSRGHLSVEYRNPFLNTNWAVH